MGNPGDPGLLEEITGWREGGSFGASLGEVTHTEEVPLYDVTN